MFPFFFIKDIFKVALQYLFNVFILLKTVFLTKIYFYTKNRLKNLYFLKPRTNSIKLKKNIQKSFGNPVTILIYGT